MLESAHPACHSLVNKVTLHLFPALGLSGQCSLATLPGLWAKRKRSKYDLEKNGGKGRRVAGEVTGYIYLLLNSQWPYGG